MRTTVNSIHDELSGNPFFGLEDGTPSGPQSKPGDPSPGTAMKEVASSALNEADDILLRSLGVRWEAKAGEAEVGAKP